MAVAIATVINVFVVAVLVVAVTAVSFEVVIFTGSMIPRIRVFILDDVVIISWLGLDDDLDLILSIRRDHFGHPFPAAAFH